MDSYDNYLKCYKYRVQLKNSDPAKIEGELNLMMFYKVLKDVIEKNRDALNI